MRGFQTGPLRRRAESTRRRTLEQGMGRRWYCSTNPASAAWMQSVPPVQASETAFLLPHGALEILARARTCPKP